MKKETTMHVVVSKKDLVRLLARSQGVADKKLSLIHI